MMHHIAAFRHLHHAERLSIQKNSPSLLYRRIVLILARATQAFSQSSTTG